MQKLGKKILVVDDSENIHEDFNKVLSLPPSNPKLEELESFLFTESEKNLANFADKFEIGHAHSGEESIEMVKGAIQENAPYALIFMDIRMPPGMDGVNAAKKIYEIDREVQVVFCTAHSDYSLEQITKDLSHSDRFLFLRKPFEPIEVTQIAYCLTQKWIVARRLKQRTKEMDERLSKRLFNLQKANDDLNLEIVRLNEKIKELKS